MSKEYECKICTKKYTSYQGLWNHNKIYHILIADNKLDENNIKTKNKKCNYCKRLFTNNFTVKRHELKCNYKNDNLINNNPINNNLIDDNPINDNPINNNPINNNSINNNSINDIEQLLELEIAKEKNKELELEIVKEKNKELELKITLEKILLKKCKMHPKTFSALNKILINKSLTNSNNNINSNNITNNNYYNIVGFGRENLTEVLTYNEKKQIMKSRFNCLEEIIRIAHCSNYKQFKNIIITNLKDNIAYKYDNKLKYFITIDKNELVDELIDNRVCDIGEIYTELMENNKLDETTARLIKEFIEKINEDNNYKTQQNQQIRILLYNNKELITNDINSIINKNKFLINDE